MSKSTECYEVLSESLKNLKEGYSKLLNGESYNLGELRRSVDSINSIIKRIFFFRSNRFGLSKDRLFMAYEQVELSFGTPCDFNSRNSALIDSIKIPPNRIKEFEIDTTIPVSVSLAKGVAFEECPDASIAKISSNLFCVAIRIVEECVFIGFELKYQKQSKWLFPRQILLVLSKDCCLLENFQGEVSILEYDSDLSISNQNFAILNNTTVEESWILEIQKEISNLASK